MNTVTSQELTDAGDDRDADPKTGLKKFRETVLILLRRNGPGGVSRIHLYEARERYEGLRRDVEYQLTLAEHADAAPTEEQEANLEKRKRTLSLCQDILDDVKGRLTRRQDDLNRLWRALTRVHIMLLEHVYDDRQLVNQLTFFREEAYRLNVQNDSAVTSLLQGVAEVMKEQDVGEQDRPRLIRALRAALERFTSIRTGRMHQQYVNLRTYKFALIILLPISFLMIANADLLTDMGNGTFVDQAVPLETNDGSAQRVLSYTFLGLLQAIREGLASNVLAFVYFAGLAGGFFSAAIRSRAHGVEPGEDAYFTWYVLSKPLVGALGAMILFILLGGGFVSFQVLQDVTASWTPGPTLFGFGFLSGFSERLVFPELR